MNPYAKNYFDANPAAKYWYASPSIRFPNPKLRRRHDWTDDPWPTHATPTR